MALSRFAGTYNAFNFAYGVDPNVDPLRVDIQNAATGTGTVILANGLITLSDGTSFSPLNTNAPINIGSGTNAETVTPTAVNVGIQNQYDTASITANFANIHGVGDLISSATYGLQEAINFVAGQGGGTVVVDNRWELYGGSNTVLSAAVIPAGVTIQDNRNGQPGTTQVAIVTIPNAQVLTLFSVGVPLIPAPGAGSLIEVVSLTLENKFLTAAFAAGGAIQASYGNGVTIPASATIPATFLTSPTANQVTSVAGALGSNLSSAVLNTAVRLACATANFTTGGGSLIAQVAYRISTGL